MVSQNVKMEAPSSLNGNPRRQKGLAAEGVALNIIGDALENRRRNPNAMRTRWRPSTIEGDAGALIQELLLVRLGFRNVFLFVGKLSSFCFTN